MVRLRRSPDPSPAAAAAPETPSESAPTSAPQPSTEPAPEPAAEDSRTAPTPVGPTGRKGITVPKQSLLGPKPPEPAPEPQPDHPDQPDRSDQPDQIDQEAPVGPRLWERFARQQQAEAPDQSDHSVEDRTEDPTEEPAENTAEAGAADQVEESAVDGVPLNPSAPTFAVPVLLARAAHLRQGLLTALLLAAAAALMGRSLREVLLVALTVLVGQCILGWHNDVVDAERDHRHDAPGKPVGQGLLEPGTVWYAIGLAALVLLPLAVLNGVSAGVWFLFAMVLGLLSNIVLRDTPLSWLLWAGTWALYVPFLTHGGWGGQYRGSDPDWRVMLLAAGVGVCVHVLTSLPGLLPDHRDGSRSLPLLLGLGLGAPRVWWLASVTLAGLCVAILMVARANSHGG